MDMQEPSVTTTLMTKDPSLSSWRMYPQNSAANNKTKILSTTRDGVSQLRWNIAEEILDNYKQNLGLEDPMIVAASSTTLH